MRLFYSSLITLLISLALAGCSGETQQPNSTLYEAKVSPEITAQPANSFSQDINLGSESNTVPLKITWTSNLDKDGCLKIVDVKVARTGGSPNIIISGLRHETQPCAMDFEATDDKRFQPALVFFNYKFREGVKSNEISGKTITIRGDGKLINNF
jgi:hypothetical protein